MPTRRPSAKKSRRTKSIGSRIYNAMIDLDRAVAARIYGPRRDHPTITKRASEQLDARQRIPQRVGRHLVHVVAGGAVVVTALGIRHAWRRLRSGPA